MLEATRTLVQTHTSGLTDGQFFGFGLLLIGALAFLVWVAYRLATNWLVDYRLRKHLRSLGHGGLHFEHERRR